MTLQRIDDGFEHPPIVCAHAWIVANKCAWCGTRIAPQPVARIKYNSSWDNYFDDDGDEGCLCGVIGCEECDEEYYENFDCGMMQDGLCTKAGSEECDWECPFSE